MRAPGFLVGGCVYRSQVHVTHATSVAALAVHASRPGYPDLVGFDYAHTSDLPRGRALWLRRCIADTSADWAISVDSDTEFVASDLVDEIARVDGAIALGLAPIRQGGTHNVVNLNVRETPTSDERRIDGGELGQILEGDRLISSGGFGLAVFNLRWFRQCMKSPHPAKQDIGTGEDIAFCRAIAECGGLIIALAVRTVHHEYRDG